MVHDERREIRERYPRIDVGVHTEAGQVLRDMTGHGEEVYQLAYEQLAADLNRDPK